jgi:hypothetical protein
MGQIDNNHSNPPTNDDYTMRMTLMYRNNPCTIINVDFLHQKIKIENRTDDLLHRAFGIIEQPSWEDFKYFLQSRCFTKTRGLLKEALQDIEVDSYDPLQIIERTKGRTAEDDLWIKITYPGVAENTMAYRDI